MIKYRKPIGPETIDEIKNYILSKIKVNKETGCWEHRSASSGGYIRFKRRGINWTFHRYTYFHLVGNIPEGMHVRHMCHNPLCGNPEHLKVGTAKQNWHDSKEKHLNSAKNLRKVWVVDGVSYGTCRDVVKNTGIPMYAVIKYTVDGVFQSEEYSKIKGDSIKNLKLGAEAVSKNVVINGMEYKSISAASRATGMTRRKIVKLYLNC